MINFVKRFFKIRIIRYGLVGGIGIPVNLLALFVFLRLMGQSLYPVANACAFIFSNLVNFILNQIFTYREQVQDIHGWEWVKRFLKGQLTSLSALLISYTISLVLVYAFHMNDYVANFTGIIIAFLYNFFISNKLVFRPTTNTTPTEMVQKITNVDVMTIVTEQEAEAIPK